jgi:hypothetical protein
VPGCSPGGVPEKGGREDREAMSSPDEPALQVDLDAIKDPGVRHCVQALLNIIERQASEIRALKQENARLRDEVARLKGEQGRPKISGTSAKGGSGTGTNCSSEKERRQPKEWKKEGKIIRVDREERCALDRGSLPNDVKFKGYEDVVVQDIIFKTDNVLFRREKYYSPSRGETYLAPLPPGYDSGEFGPGLRAYVITQYWVANVSEPKILEVLRSRGIIISAGQLSNILTHRTDQFHEEKQEVHRAGLQSAPWQQADDTGTRVDGVTRYCHVIGNAFYTIFATLDGKSRLHVLDLLRGGSPRAFLFNDTAHALAKVFGVSDAVLAHLRPLGMQRQAMDERSFTKTVKKCMPEIGERQLAWVLQAAAIADYHTQDTFPIVRALLSDDAPQYGGLVDEHALCWIHDGRLYKKLTPVVPLFQNSVEDFLDKYWRFYRDLLAYKSRPTKQKAAKLERRFDRLFSTKTAYDELNDRIAKTKAKKQELLLVLKHPELPLHNNGSELAARQRVRKRDVSFGPRTVNGARNWDTFQSLVATAKKLGVNLYEYFHDRVRGIGLVPRLAKLIEERAEASGCHGSWAAPEPAS